MEDFAEKLDDFSWRLRIMTCTAEAYFCRTIRNKKKRADYIRMLHLYLERNETAVSFVKKGNPQDAHIARARQLLAEADTAFEAGDLREALLASTDAYNLATQQETLEHYESQQRMYEEIGQRAKHIHDQTGVCPLCEWNEQHAGKPAPSNEGGTIYHLMRWMEEGDEQKHDKLN